MVKRTAEISPNSERVISKKSAKNRLPPPPKINSEPSSSNPSTSSGATHPGEAPTSTPPKEVSTPRYEKTDGTLNTSMRSTDQSPGTTRHTAFTSKPLDFVDVEIYKKDDEPFDGLLPRDTLKLLWTELGRNVEEIRVLKCERILRKCLKVTYHLRKEVPLLEISNTFEILVEAKLGPRTHTFAAKFPQYREIVCELGQLITVTVCNVPSEADSEDLRQWIEVFGSVKGKFRYHSQLISACWIVAFELFP
jgi:hypothetical protein